MFAPTSEVADSAAWVADEGGDELDSSSPRWLSGFAAVFSQSLAYHVRPRHPAALRNPIGCSRELVG
jgi:hypothetical protein